MELFNEHIDKTVIDTLESIVASDFVRLSYTEAVEILEKLGHDVRVSRSPGATTCRPSTSAI